MRRIMFIELGMGVDLRGEDTTKAALRAVRDAIQRNFMPGVRALTGGEESRMHVLVRLGVPEGAAPVDAEAVRASLPHGVATVEIGPGGLLVPNGFDDGGRICIVNAAVQVSVETEDAPS